MNVSEALLHRKSVRAFTKQSIDVELIKRLLALAGQAPSGANLQPWQVHVLTGESKLLLQQQMEKAFQVGIHGVMDYQYYPVNWTEPFKSRRKECALSMYSALGISRDEEKRRQAQWCANYRAFDAPVMMLFSIKPELETGSFIDFGLFLQSLMLVATEQGLATCPQAALAEYPNIVKPFLKISNNDRLLCGLALGYEDKSAKVNQYRTVRADVETWSTFLD